MSNIYPLTFETPLLCDSAAAIAPDAVDRSKFAGRVFYLRKKVGGVDSLDRAEADIYKRLGLEIVVNYEDAAANWTLGGYAIGRDRGDWAAEQLEDCDVADIATVYLSVDVRPSGTGQMNAVMECLRGFQESALGRRGRGVYGFSPVIREAKRRNLADYFWMCGDGNDLFDGGASTGRRNDLTYVNLWQQNNFFDSVAGVQVDVNYALLANHGQWTTEGDFLMSLNDSQQHDIAVGAEQFSGPSLTVRKAPSWLARFLPSSFRDPKGVWVRDEIDALVNELVTGTFNLTDPIDFGDGKGPVAPVDIPVGQKVNAVTLLRVLGARQARAQGLL